jgi:hypothetical protein
VTASSLFFFVFISLFHSGSPGPAVAPPPHCPTMHDVISTVAVALGSLALAAFLAWFIK